MGFFSRIKKIFGAPSQAEEQAAVQQEQEPERQPNQQSESQQQSGKAEAPETGSEESTERTSETPAQKGTKDRPASEESGKLQEASAEEAAVVGEEKEEVLLAEPLSVEPVSQQVEACPAEEKSEDADEAGRAGEALEEGQKAKESATPTEEKKPEAALDARAVCRPVEEHKSAEPAAESEVSVEKSESTDERSDAPEAAEAAEPATEAEASAEKTESTGERSEALEAQEAPEAAESAEPKAAVDPWAAFRPVEEVKAAPEPEQAAEAVEPAAEPEVSVEKFEGTDEKSEAPEAPEAAEAVKLEAAMDPWAAFRPAEEAKEASEPEIVAKTVEPAVQPEASADKFEGTDEKAEAAEAPEAEEQKSLEDAGESTSAKPCAEEEGTASAAVAAQQSAQGEAVQDAGQKADEGGEDEIIIDLGAPLMPEDWEENRKKEEEPAAAVADLDYSELTLRLREAEARLSVWLDIVLDGVTEAGDELNRRVTFLLRTLEAPADEAKAFVDDFAGWLERMEYRQIEDFRSELQYRLALALDLEDEEDERSRLFLKLSNSLAKTRAQFARHFEGLISSHGELDDEFWEELEEIFIMADLGVEAAMELTERLRTRAREQKVTTSEGARELLREEIRSIFARPRHIVGITPPEVVLMIGVNGAGKTTTIAKLAYRDRMQGKKVMIAAADTFRAAAIEQLQVWATRVGALFHAKQAGSDPASVAYEAMDRAMSEGVDVLYVDTAGRLQTKVNLMDELAKIRNVIARKHPGAPHRTVLVLDATTGQNALSQAKLFKESAGVDELILTKLDGTAKGGVAIAVAMQHKLPITYVGLGEKVEDLRPFNGDDYAEALLKI